MLAVHGTAPFRLVRTAAPYFRVKDGEPRCVVNISSTSGTHGKQMASPSQKQVTDTHRQRRPSKLLIRQIRCRRSIENNRQRMGTTIRRSRQHCCFRPHYHTVRSDSLILACPANVNDSLTASKEDGAFIQTADGQRVALGIPTKQLEDRKGADPNAAFKDIPLGRPGSPTEAAMAVLAVASPLFSYVNGQLIEVTGGRGM